MVVVLDRDGGGADEAGRGELVVTHRDWQEGSKHSRVRRTCGESTGTKLDFTRLFFLYVICLRRMRDPKSMMLSPSAANSFSTNCTRFCPPVSRQQSSKYGAAERLDVTEEGSTASSDWPCGDLGQGGSSYNTDGSGNGDLGQASADGVIEGSCGRRISAFSK
ncbi:hypothetical protein NL676_024878 [Syzygium grande]|nr:hypothetical protein NL676_024878 [Syzygium grande]